MKYFATCGSQIVQLSNVWHSGAMSIKASEFIGTCPVCGQKHQATRKVQYKAFPSRHQCGPRCINAHGHLCECACGGKNHGRAAA